ncbi:MAG: hypothetical protein AMS24_04645 [Chlamydiae bacterium SM23_39]|nr:MAG: hypothetical protein AMS24_04645 [Chlamydiae bacterium SM23_39]
MNEFILKIFSDQSLIYALLASFLACIASSTIGSYVVIKKISSITGSISHSILGGIGIILYLNYKYNLSYNPIWGAFIFAFLAALILGFMHIKYRQKEDAIIAAIWSTGMGIGVIFISYLPTPSADFIHFLFGDIFSLTKTSLYTLSIFDILILGSIFLFYKKFLLISLDEESAKLQKININIFYFFLLTLISLSIVVLVQMVGIVLLIAILTIPPSIANIFKKKLSSVMLLSLFLSLLFFILGIFISYKSFLPSGAVIAIICSIFYLLVIILKKKTLTS